MKKLASFLRSNAVDALPEFLLTAHSNSVLPPPPPRYSVPIAYAAGASNGMAVPIIETNNILSHPEGGCPLQVGEGESSIHKPELHLTSYRRDSRR
jgi:hypothetical protein